MDECQGRASRSNAQKKVQHYRFSGEPGDSASAGSPQLKLSAYLNDAAPSGRRLHGVQEDRLGILAAGVRALGHGEDDPASPASPGRSPGVELGGSVFAQSVPIALPLRHREKVKKQ